MASSELGPGVWAGLASAATLALAKLADWVIARRQFHLRDSLTDVEVGQAVRDLYADMMADADKGWQKKLVIALAESEARCRIETEEAVAKAKAECQAEIEELRRLLES